MIIPKTEANDTVINNQTKAAKSVGTKRTELNDNLVNESITSNQAVANKVAVKNKTDVNETVGTNQTKQKKTQIVYDKKVIVNSKNGSNPILNQAEAPKVSSADIRPAKEKM